VDPKLGVMPTSAVCLLWHRWKKKR